MFLVLKRRERELEHPRFIQSTMRHKSILCWSLFRCCCGRRLCESYLKMQKFNLKKKTFSFLINTEPTIGRLWWMQQWNNTHNPIINFHVHCIRVPLAHQKKYSQIRSIVPQLWNTKYNMTIAKVILLSSQRVLRSSSCQFNDNRLMSESDMQTCCCIMHLIWMIILHGNINKNWNCFVFSFDFCY